jgi:hypothetical protein
MVRNEPCCSVEWCSPTRIANFSSDPEQRRRRLMDGKVRTGLRSRFNAQDFTVPGFDRLDSFRSMMWDQIH